jgi:hypothetical protein
VVINLPPALGEILNMCGVDWPMSNEDMLFEIGNAWMGLPESVDQVLSGVNEQGAKVWDENLGDAVDAFTTWWNGEDGPATVLSEGTIGMYLTGAGMMVCAAIVLALKIACIIQLAILAVQIASAIAAAAATMGIAAAALPAIYAIGREILMSLVQEAVMRLLM